ncbi:MAG: hypothetical protein GDA44_08260 [Prochloron sp. SP5CPC1]|nr:hypothetical protein [Candidatus Paraprochloron terpiosi SP5CPC1]
MSTTQVNANTSRLDRLETLIGNYIEATAKDTSEMKAVIEMAITNLQAAFAKETADLKVNLDKLAETSAQETAELKANLDKLAETSAQETAEIRNEGSFRQGNC